MAEAEELGVRLRRIRFERRLTLQAAGSVCGVGASTLSKIETGQASQAYGTLKRIAEGLDLSFEELISGQRSTQVSARRSVTRRSETLKFKSSRHRYYVQAKALVRKAMIPLEMDILATDPPGSADWSSHDGEEFIFVLEGEIQVHLETYSPFTLKAGESAYIDSGMRHAFVSVGTASARMLSVCFDPKHQARSADEFLRASGDR